MTVKLTADSKKLITLEELPIAKEIIKNCKDDEMSVAEYAKIAVLAIGEGCEKVYEASAEIAKNNRVWNAFGENSKTFDVWLEATARTWNGFVEIGAYLTDIWNICGEDKQTKYMWIQKFTIQK